MHDYDRSSKWLIQHHGDSILRLAGIRNIESWRALQSEVVQPRRLPDGLMEARIIGEAENRLYLLELATYPEKRVADQMTEEMMLVWLDRQIVPESIVVVLHPRGRAAPPRQSIMTSATGTAAFTFQWTVVKLWDLKAADLLKIEDVGIVPWVPLTRHRRNPAKSCRSAATASTVSPGRRTRQSACRNTDSGGFAV